MVIRHFAKRALISWFVCLVVVLIASSPFSAQTPSAASRAQSIPAPEATPTPADGNENLEKNFFRNILSDQRAIWTAPFHLRRDDAKWALPLTVSFAGLLASDKHTSGELVEDGDNQQRLRISRYVSQLGAFYTTGGIAAGLYVVGRTTHNSRARETGLLAGEALLNGAIVGEILKAVSQRQRPPADDGSGKFFHGGSSFPSGHAISAWTLATIVDQEYGQNRLAVRIGAYALATAVSMSRYTGRNHFLSDVLMGSAIGYGIGRYVYHRRHDPSLDDGNAKKISKVIHSKLFPEVAPRFAPRAQAYGAMLAWSF